jgi:branched-chain amino acid transport system substrate-binding protein
MASTQERVIRIGLVTALTGKFSLPGRQALVGVQAWVDDTNRRGGIRLGASGERLPVQLVFYDDASTGERCSAGIERLIVHDRVDVLLGPYASGLARRAVVVAQRYGKVLWNHGGSTDAIYESGSAWVVGILTPASQYFHGVIEVVRRLHPRAQRLAVLHITAGTFPREVALGAVRYGQEHGFTSIRTYTYQTGTLHFAPLLQQLAQDQPEVLLGVGRIEDDIRFATQLCQAAVPVTAVGLIATPLTLFHHSLGAAAEKFLGPSQWEPGIVSHPDYGPSAQDVLASLVVRAPEGVDYPMAQAYAGCLVAQRCIEMVGCLDQEALRHAANCLDFTTFYGRFRIDPATGRQFGHVMPVVQWRHGTKVMVWP